jgi:hypothetical protein
VIEELGSPLLCASIGLVDAAGNAITEPVRQRTPPLFSLPALMCWCWSDGAGRRIRSPPPLSPSSIAFPTERASRARLHELLGRKVDFVVDAGIDAEPRVSTVVDLTDPENPVVLREGAGSVAEMQAFL